MAPSKMGGPASLYNLSVNTVADNYHLLKKEVKVAPGNVQFDIYHRVSKTSFINLHTDFQGPSSCH